MKVVLCTMVNLDKAVSSLNWYVCKRTAKTLYTDNKILYKVRSICTKVQFGSNLNSLQQKFISTSNYLGSAVAQW